MGPRHGCVRLGVLRTAGPLLAAGGLLGVLGLPSVALAEGCTTTGATVTCAYTAQGETAFTVPEGVSTLTATVVGAQGAPEYEGNPGGLGAVASGPISVTPGNSLYFDVDVLGGAPGTKEGYGPAGAGGGESDIRTCSATATCPGGTLASRLLVAGGGGGASEADPGSGGNAGTPSPGSNGAPGEYGAEGGLGATTAGPGSGGAHASDGGTSGESGSAEGGQGGAGGDAAEEYSGSGGGGGGGGYYGGGGGGGTAYNDEYAAGGGGGSSYAAPSVMSHSFAQASAGQTPEVQVVYTVPPTCSTVAGHGLYKKPHETGRLKLEDSLSIELAASQQLHVRYESGKVHFRLTKLENASCTGEPGERDFQGEGAAAVGTGKASHGFTVSFSIYEKEGGFFFASKLMKGSQEVEASGGPLRKSTEVIH